MPFDTDAPSFYTFWWYPGADIKKGPDDFYYINVFASDGRTSKEGGANDAFAERDSFRFHQDKSKNQLKETDIMVCIGGGNCDVWESSKTAIEVFTPQPTSSTPGRVDATTEFPQIGSK